MQSNGGGASSPINPHLDAFKMILKNFMKQIGEAVAKLEVAQKDADGKWDAKLSDVYTRLTKLEVGFTQAIADAKAEVIKTVNDNVALLKETDDKAAGRASVFTVILTVVSVVAAVATVLISVF